MIFNLLKEQKQKISFEPEEYTEIGENTLEIDPPLSHERQLLEYFFKLLGKTCRELLTLSFYRGLTNDEIAEMGNYENESVVRSQKSRCLRNLKQMIAERNR
jgi:RNA polymerase sigma-70 factor (ECF subfamily)